MVNTPNTNSVQDELRVMSAHKFQGDLQQKHSGSGKSVGGMSALDSADMLKAISSLGNATGSLQIQGANLSSMLTPTVGKLEPASICKPAESMGSKWQAHVEGHQDGENAGRGH